MSRSEEISVLNLKPTSYSSCLREKKELNVLAVENDIQPNLLRNWKKEFLTNASLLLITSEKTISGKNLPKNARKKPNTPKRSVNLLCRLTGSKKNLKKLSDLTTRSKFSPKPFDE